MNINRVLRFIEPFRIFSVKWSNTENIGNSNLSEVCWCTALWKWKNMQICKCYEADTTKMADTNFFRLNRVEYFEQHLRIWIGVREVGYFLKILNNFFFWNLPLNSEKVLFVDSSNHKKSYSNAWRIVEFCSDGSRRSPKPQ